MLRTMSIAAVLFLTAGLAWGQGLSEDFEAGNLDNWDVVVGVGWEVVEEDGSMVAHAPQDSTAHRRIVSLESIPGDVAVTARVKGKAHAAGDDAADIGVCFYSNAAGTHFYCLCLGGTGAVLTLKECDGSGCVDKAVASGVESEDEIWYFARVRVEGSTVRGKIWKVVENEPEGWQVEFSEAQSHGGHIVLGGFSGENDEEFWFDDIEVSQINVVPAVTDWGLLVMALVGLAAGTIMFREARRRAVTS